RKGRTKGLRGDGLTLECGATRLAATRLAATRLCRYPALPLPGFAAGARRGGAAAEMRDFCGGRGTINMAAITLLEAIRQGLWEEMERDHNVFLLGEDIGVYGGAFKVTEGFIQRFGEERVIDTPISETAIVGAACGAAMMGMRPVAEMQFI